MLEQICERLEVDPVALLAMACCHARQESLPAYTAHLQAELAKLEAMGVFSSMPSHFKDGVLRTGKAGKRPIPLAKIEAVYNCKAEGLSQKETAIKLGMSTTTVHKIWHSQPD
ncbi:sigma-70 family RNA polymerase sigma factor [Pseudomonas sp. NMI1173_11]|uniref:sigma-70 family RNA polymerase sigma factor n=1 Tax=Pseudomonas sp. NMI1173_11 TaxID=2903145 RepID=UPI001E3C4720|nr:sigma-70 family RNA polymerase sigma factor [Pseudomonas sp. NMI1173_11]MCE1004384.1 sigma-70 family RNA polymerase sigma factor [Pseudomonas sp. NMI1173_11]